jgi:hypothetical protein
MDRRGVEFGIATLAITQTVGAFTAFLPNFTEIGRSDKDSVEGEVRLGETAAVVIALSVGGMLGWLTGSAVPFYISVLMTFILIAMYEAALRKDV